MPELLLGCGSSREKRLYLDERPDWTDLITCDINPAHDPDVVWDLRKKPWPWPDSTFQEAHCYELLEHLGAQGDEESFFSDFAELWRILAPDGMLFATVPWWQGRWAWGDPSHKRVIQPESLIFLSQSEYDQVGQTPMSDFRYLWRADFATRYTKHHVPTDGFHFILQAIKPSRWSGTTKT